MSVGYNKSSVIGGSLDPIVISQLEQRSNQVSKLRRTPEDLTYLHSKTSWVKMTSSVNVGDSSTLAQNNILFGGVLAPDNQMRSGMDFNNTSNPAYTNPEVTEYYKSLGIRPMPGISDVTISSKNTFGTLREAKVNFKCWTVDQLTDLEKLYMRPGFTVVLEWGHSIFIENDSTTGNTKISSDINTVSNLLEKGIKKDQIMGEIYDRKKEFSGNYDGFFGYIKNFQWSYNPQGGYDCVCDIITMGEIIESIGLLVTPQQSTGKAEPAFKRRKKTSETEAQEEDQGFFDSVADFFSSEEEETTPEKSKEVKPDVNATATAFHAFLNTIRTAKPEYKDYKQNKKYKDTEVYTDLEKYNSYLYTKIVDSYFGKLPFQVLEYGVNGKDDVNFWNKTLRYITFRDFLALLNESFIFGEPDGKKLIQFSTSFIKSPMLTFRDHIGIDLGVCLLSKNQHAKDNLVYDPSISRTGGTASIKLITNYEIEVVEDIYSKFPQDRIKLEKQKIYQGDNTFTPGTSILDIWINVDYLFSKATSMITSPNTDLQTVLNFVRQVLRDLQVNLGDVNDFDLHYDEEIFTYFAVDRKVIPEDDLSVINLTGLKSTVTDISLTSKITSKLSSMLAVSAQATKSDVSLNTQNMFRWNAGLTDRFIPKKVLYDSVVEGSASINTDDFKSLYDYIKYVNEERYYIKDEVTGLKTVHRHLMQKLLEEADTVSKKSSAGIIPFELSFTLDGIGGLKIGQAFKINEGILPETYDESIGFLINGIDHSISDNRWSTTVKAQTILVKPPASTTPPLEENITDVLVETVVSEPDFQPSKNTQRLPNSLFTTTPQITSSVIGITNNPGDPA